MLVDISFGREIIESKSNLNSHEVEMDNQEKYIFELRERIVELNKENEALSNLVRQILIQSEPVSPTSVAIVREIVSSIAHEINQPLTAIIAYSRGCIFLIKNQLKNKKSCEKLLFPIEKMAMLAEYAGNTMYNMKNFILDEEVFFEKIDVNMIINESIFILKNESLDFNMKLTLSLMEMLPEVRGNKIHIIQVVLNLARNSIEALKRISNSQPELIIKTHVLDQFIVVDVIDNGPGFPSKEQDTSADAACYHHESKGLGIGLGICQALIEAHGGKLSVKNGIANGAWFSFTLPMVDE